MTSLKEFNKMSDKNLEKKMKSDSSDDGWQTESEDFSSKAKKKQKLSSKKQPQKNQGRKKSKFSARLR